MLEENLDQSATLASLRDGAYDFIDFGCSRGDSLQFGTERLGGKRGIGVDKDPTKVSDARARGFEALAVDATKLDAYPDVVSFVLMSHFLEHLPGYRLARNCMQSGMTIARDFVLIKQPWFDSDGWLFGHGLKFFWSDWRGHDFTMTQLQFYRALRDIAIPCRYRMYGRRPVHSSDDLAIHPLQSPFDQHAYKEELHGPKSTIPITVPTFYEVQCLILLSRQMSFNSVERVLDGGQENLLLEGEIS